MKIFLLYFLLLLTALGQDAPATAPTPMPVPPALPGLNAIVPYDPSKPLATTEAAAHYFLDQATFQKLWTASARARGDSAALPPGKALALTQAAYQIGLEKDYWLVKGHLSVFTAQPWAELELNFPGATLTESFIDDAATAPVKGRLAFEKPGAHVVALTLRLPYDSSIGALKFQFPAAGATLAQVRAPLTSGLFAPESPQLPSTAAEENGQRLVTVALGHATELSLQRQRAVVAGVGAPAAAAQATADLRQGVELHATWDRLRVEGNYHFPPSFAGKLELDFPADFVPVTVETPGAANWELRQENGRQILSFRPARSDSRECTVFLIAERQHAEPEAPNKEDAPSPSPPLSVSLPLPLAGAGSARGSRTVTIYEGRGLQVQPQPAAEHRRLPLPAEESLSPDARPVAAFDYPPAAAPLSVLIGTPRQKRRVQADYIFQVGRGKLEEIVTATFSAPGESFVTAAVGLPAGMVPQTVTGNELAEWSLSGERLFLRFQPGTRDGATVIIHTAKEITAVEAMVGPQKEGLVAPADKTAPLPLQSLTFEGFPEVSGHGLLMAHAAEEVLLRIGKGILREENPASSPVQATILPPFQRKQAFVFKETAFEATVALRRLDPQFTATWVLVAGVNESWTTLTYRVDLEIGRSALSSVRLLLPPGLNGVRVTGAEVREVRPVAEDKEHTALDVTFQHDMLDAVQLQVECDQPAAAAGVEAWLPGITVTGADAGPAFLILDNLTNWEMSVKEEKTEVARVGDLPFVPGKLNNPRFYRALPGWKIAPSITKLVTTGGEKVLISQADLATFIRSNGDEWLRARYRILNRSLQFLPVKLPAQSEVISARVGGESVRTEKSADGTADILIPLIQTRPGEISYEVEIVLLRRGAGKLDAKLVRKMSDPALPGLTVQHTLWEVHAPPGYTMEQTGGNMETVDEVESKADKLYNLLSEADKLNRMAKDEKISVMEQQIACGNSLILQEKINRELSGGQPTNEYSVYSNSEGSVNNGRRAAANQKLNDIQQKWGELNKDTQENYQRLNSRATNPADPAGQPTSGIVLSTDGPQAAREAQQDLTNWSFNGKNFQERESRLKQQSEQQAKTLENAAVALNDNLVLEQSVLQRGGQQPGKDASGKAENAEENKLAELTKGMKGGDNPVTYNDDFFNQDSLYFKKLAEPGLKAGEKPQAKKSAEFDLSSLGRLSIVDEDKKELTANFAMKDLLSEEMKSKSDPSQPIAGKMAKKLEDTQTEDQTLPQVQQLMRQNAGNNARALQNRAQLQQSVEPGLQPSSQPQPAGAPQPPEDAGRPMPQPPQSAAPVSQSQFGVNSGGRLDAVSGPAAGSGAGVALNKPALAPMDAGSPMEIPRQSGARGLGAQQGITSGGAAGASQNGQRLGYLGDFNVSAAPVFKPGGRYALPVELSGGVALGQFRKLKGDAELEITLTPVAKGPGLLPSLLQLGLALAALWMLQKVHEWRQRWRAAVLPA